MRNSGLRPRAISALSIVAASLFLLLCLANYGHGGFETAGEAPWHLSVAGWFVDVFGAGAYSLVLLPLIWGLVVYFREDTPSLPMRAAGTLLLACSISMVSGLAQNPAEMSWAGAVGEYTVALAQGLGAGMGEALALALAWAAAVTLFMASLVWATDWFFHSLRKGPVVPVLAMGGSSVATEPASAELWDAGDAMGSAAGDDAPYGMQDAHRDTPYDVRAEAPREFVAMPTAGARATAAVAAEPPAAIEPLPAHEVPEGFSVRHTGDRMVVRGPVGYQGVEFLPASDELAHPAPAEARFAHNVQHEEERVLDDEVTVTAAAAREIDVTIGAYAMSEVPPEVPPESEPLFGEPIATVEETLGTAADVVEREPVAESRGTPAAPSALPGEHEPDGEATDAATVRPRSGIGLPDDSPFVDEFFSVADVVVSDTYLTTSEPSAVEDDVVSRAAAGSDGASADGEIEAAFGTSIPSPGTGTADDAGSDPIGAAAYDAGHDAGSEATGAADAATDEQTARSEPIVVDELLFADAYDIVDDEIPLPIAARSASPAPPDLAPPSDEHGSELPGEGRPSRIHDMRLDPLFHDAVESVLEAGRGSAMALQRKFGIGHGRGLRLLQQMEEAGVLGAEGDAGAREVRMARTEWETLRGSNAS